MRNRLLTTLTILAMAAVLSPSLCAKIFFVAAGVGDYPGEKNDLRLPVNDVKTMVSLYKKNSNAVCTTLTDEHATQENILKAITSNFSAAKANDIVVFYFSGHGYPGGFVAYDGKMSYDKVRQAMAKSKCKNKMIFADACYSGQIRQDGKNDGSSKAKKWNVMLFLSSRGDEPSIENKAMKNGMFTTLLEMGLRGNADSNEDRTITARELYEFVHSGVIKISKDKQHPVMWGNFSDNMPVMVW